MSRTAGRRSSAPAPKRAPWGPVLSDLPPELQGAQVDWTRWYLTDEEDMGESCEQQLIIALLLSVLQELARERRWTRCFIGADAFFAWVPEHPLVRVSPDVYILDDPPSAPMPKSWQTWLPGHHAPRWSAEIVSDDWRKDYEEAPAKYAQLGSRELVLFDPDAAVGLASPPSRVPLTIYRRGEDGVLAKSYAGDGPAYSVELGAWLQVHRQEKVARLRLSYDEAGEKLVRSVEEARSEAEQARSKAEARVRELEEQVKKLT